MRKFSKLALAGVSLTALFQPMQAFAQDKADDSAEAKSDDIIIVEARRKGEDLQEVPLSVQAVTGDELRKLEIRNFQDLGVTVPGLQLTRSANSVQNTVTLRGVSFNSTGAGPQAAVELYRNDVVTTSSALFQALYDIGQIEVLRGPQGTLRGRATPSGSITITTRRPDMDEVGGFVALTSAEDSKNTFEGAINVPIIGDKLAVRVAGYLSRDHGNEVIGTTLINGTTDNFIYDRTRSIRASVRAKPFDDILTLDFNYEATRRYTRSYQQYVSRKYVDGSGISGPVDIDFLDRQGIQARPFVHNGSYQFYNWQAQLNLVGQKLTYVGGYLRAVSDTIAPDDAAGVIAVPYARPAAVNSAPAPGTYQNLFAQLTTSSQLQTFHEVRLQNSDRIAGIFDYVGGYMHLKSNTPTLLYTPTASCAVANCSTGLATMTYGGVYRFRTDWEDSVFGNLTAHIGDRAEISGGVRHIIFKRDSGLKSAQRNAVGQLLFDQESEASLIAQPPVASFGLNDRITHTIYTISGKVDISDSLMAYATYGTSFRPGNLIVCSRCNAATNAQLLANGFLRMKDESSNSIEGGFKSSFLDKKLKFNVSVYRQKFDNFTVLSPEAIPYATATATLGSGTNSFALVNPVEVTGFEAELAYRPSDRFNISGNLAYSHSKVTNGRQPCLDLNNDNVQDTTPVTAANAAAFIAQVGANLVDTCAITRAGTQPDWSGNLQAEYNVPVTQGAEGYIRGLASYFGKTIGDEVNPNDTVPSYTLLNMYLGVRDPDGRWDLSVFARNLTNVHRALSVNGSRSTTTVGATVFGSEYYQTNVNLPREFGLSVRFAFGSH